MDQTKKASNYTILIRQGEITMYQTAFSKDGYIINQGVLTDLPFGKYPSSQNGCGWIAAYNYLKLRKKPANMDKIRNQLAHTLFFGGKSGMSVVLLYLYLRIISGCKIKFRFHLPRTAAKLYIPSGILMYHTGKSFHFIAIQHKSKEQYRFLNGIYGREQDIRTIRSFLKEHCNFPFLIMIY